MVEVVRYIGIRPPFETAANAEHWPVSVDFRCHVVVVSWKRLPVSPYSLKTWSFFSFLAYKESGIENVYTTNHKRL